jgi:hypothetical protein
MVRVTDQQSGRMPSREAGRAVSTAVPSTTHTLCEQATPIFERRTLMCTDPFAVRRYELRRELDKRPQDVQRRLQEALVCSDADDAFDQAELLLKICSSANGAWRIRRACNRALNRVKEGLLCGDPDALAVRGVVNDFMGDYDDVFALIGARKPALAAV